MLKEISFEKKTKRMSVRKGEAKMTARRISGAKVIVVVFMVLMMLGVSLDAGVAQATTGPGDLDTTFGGTGWSASSPSASYVNEARAVAVQADGKIVAVGSTNSDYLASHLTVVRYLSNGALDSSFGSGGVVDLLIGTYTEGGSVAIQPWDQKIVVAGQAGSGGKTHFFAARLCTNGTLDNGANCGSGGFGSGGSFILPTMQAGALNEYGGMSAIVQPDHKILISGESQNSSGGYSFAVARLCDSGALDNGVNCGAGGFGGSNGFVLTPSPTFNHWAYGCSLGLQTDGKIVAVGFDNYGSLNGTFLLVRYCPNGSLDNGTNCGSGGFGSGGFVTTSIPGGNGNDTPAGVVIQGDGKIVVAGNSDSAALTTGYRVALVRYCPNGQLDNGTTCGSGGFGAGGISTITAYEVGSRVNGLILQPDGKLIVLGANYYAPFPPTHAMLLRFTTGGVPDTSFSTDGGVLTLFLSGSGKINFLNAGAMQADGKIVVVGRISDNDTETEQFLVARYLGDGPFNINATVFLNTGGTISCTPSNPVAYGSQVVCTMTPFFSSPDYYHIADVSAGPSGEAASVGPTTNYTFSQVYGDKDIRVVFAKTDLRLYDGNSWRATDHTIADALLDVYLHQQDTDTIRMPTGAYAESGGVYCYEPIGITLSGGWASETLRDSSPMSAVKGPLTIISSCSLIIDGIAIE